MSRHRCQQTSGRMHRHTVEGDLRHIEALPERGCAGKAGMVFGQPPYAVHPSLWRAPWSHGRVVPCSSVHGRPRFTPVTGLSLALRFGPARPPARWGTPPWRLCRAVTPLGASVPRPRERRAGTCGSLGGLSPSDTAGGVPALPRNPARDV